MFKNAEDSVRRKNWDWRTNPIRIRRGQYWKKNDNGNIGYVSAVSENHVYMQQPRKRKCHHVTKKDLLMFWKIL